MKAKKIGKSLLLGILLTLAVCGADFLIIMLYLWPKALDGSLIPVRRASEDLPASFMQGLIPFLLPLGLLVLFALFLKKDFTARLYLGLRGKWQRAAALVLGAAILGLTGYCLVVKEDRAAVIWSLFYYLVFIGFGEEYGQRDGIGSSGCCHLYDILALLCSFGWCGQRQPLCSFRFSADVHSPHHEHRLFCDGQETRCADRRGGGEG